jgi:hypothetical protein
MSNLNFDVCFAHFYNILAEIAVRSFDSVFQGYFAGGGVGGEFPPNLKVWIRGRGSFSPKMEYEYH